MIKNIQIQLFLLLLASCFLSFIILSKIPIFPGPAILKKHGLYIPYNILFFSFLFLTLITLENLKKLNDKLIKNLFYGLLAGHFLGGLALVLSGIFFDTIGMGWVRFLNSFKNDFWFILFYYLIGSGIYLGWLSGLLSIAIYFYFRKIFLPRQNQDRYHSVKIINESSKSLPINLVKTVKKLLQHIPNEHLFGLDSVTIMDDFPHKDHKDAAGLYYAKYKSNPGYIQLSIAGIYGSAPYKICLVPFFTKFWLAQTLFHEIGHHYKHLTHGISKKEDENFADQYQKKFIKRVVYPWRYALKPLVWAYKFAKKRGLFKDSESSE